MNFCLRVPHFAGGGWGRSGAAGGDGGGEREVRGDPERAHGPQIEGGTRHTHARAHPEHRHPNNHTESARTPGRRPNYSPPIPTGIRARRPPRQPPPTRLREEKGSNHSRTGRRQLEKQQTTTSPMGGPPPAHERHGSTAALAHRSQYEQQANDEPAPPTAPGERGHQRDTRVLAAHCGTIQNPVTAPSPRPPNRHRARHKRNSFQRTTDRNRVNANIKKQSRREKRCFCGKSPRVPKLSLTVVLTRPVAASLHKSDRIRCFF